MLTEDFMLTHIRNTSLDGNTKEWEQLAGAWCVIKAADVLGGGLSVMNFLISARYIGGFK